MSTRRLGQLSIALILAAALYGGLDLAAPPIASALSCTGASSQAFAGNVDPHTNAVRGAKAAIEYVNEALCTTAGGDDFSSFWVAVTGNNSPLDIYQIGIDKCRGDACADPDAPVNQPYFLWAYGHHTSASCGAAVGPEPNYLGNATTGTKTYKVVREYQQGAGFFYNLYIGSTAYRKWYQTEWSLDTCWNGVDAAQFFNEVWDPNAQSGGSTSNHQTWSSVYWYTGSTWQAVIGNTGSNCDAHDRSNQKCVWNSFDPSKWDSWDTHY